MASRRIVNYKLIVLANISVIWVAFAFLFLYNIILIDKNDVTGRSLIIFSLAFATIGFVVSAKHNFITNILIDMAPIGNDGLSYILKEIMKHVEIFFMTYFFCDSC